MPEKQLTKRFYQICLDGKLFYQHFQTKEKAKEFAKLNLEINKFELVEIYLIEEYLEVVEELQK